MLLRCNLYCRHRAKMKDGLVILGQTIGYDFSFFMDIFMNENCPDIGTMDSPFWDEVMFAHDFL